MFCRKPKSIWLYEKLVNYFVPEIIGENRKKNIHTYGRLVEEGARCWFGAGAVRREVKLA